MVEGPQRGQAGGTPRTPGGEPTPERAGKEIWGDLLGRTQAIAAVRRAVDLGVKLF